MSGLGPDDVALQGGAFHGLPPWLSTVSGTIRGLGVALNREGGDFTNVQPLVLTGLETSPELESESRDDRPLG